MGSFSIWHWLIVLVIVVLVFGTKRLTGGARDLGKAVDEFKKGMRGEDDKPVVRPVDRIDSDRIVAIRTDDDRTDVNRPGVNRPDVANISSEPPDRDDVAR